MKCDFPKLIDCMERQTSPEPFSGVVYLTQGETVLFERACGCAIRSERIPNKINTRFQMASGCKVFTSVAICKLIESGAVSLDTLLSSCVDAVFPSFAPGITIRHLLTHTSGITSYFEEDVNPDYEDLWREVPMYKVRGPGDFLPLFQSKSMKFPPGEKFDYNDGGYILLGLVIESVTGKCFPDYIKEVVFEPAEMVDSGYFATDMLPERTAYSYIKNPDGSMRTNFFAVPIIGAPDGGAYTTAPDMLRFWTALRGNRLLSADTVGSMLNVQIATTWKAPYGYYGHGVWIDQQDESIVKVFVEGYDPGVALRSSVYPGGDVVLTLIGNTSEALWPLYSTIETELGLR